MFLCFFHFRQFEDEKASLAMVDKAKPVIDTGNASFAFLFEKVSLNSTFGSLPTLLILFLPTALPMSELSSMDKMALSKFKKCSFYRNF